MKYSVIAFPVYILINILSLFRIDAQVFEKGKITDSLLCANHPGYSYSLYLPTNYDSRKRWPAILIFDPAARAKVAVEVFTKAAEQYGYVVACSYNSRNGPANNNFTAADYMFADLKQRFSLDEKRIFASGFSGGSRFAFSLASSGRIFAGVIGCGAGLPNERIYYPSSGSTFIYYGIVGTRDMNYLEMFDLDGFLKKTGVVGYLKTFDGGHQWPTPDIICEAVEWVEIQSINKKLRPTASAFIEDYKSKMNSQFIKLESNKNLFEAARYMAYLIRDFPGDPVASETLKSLQKLEQSAEYKNELRDWNKTANQERKLDESFVTALENVIYRESIPDTTKAWWKAEIESLIKMKQKDKPVNSQMASRLLNFVSILCSEQGLAFFRQRKWEVSGFLFEVCTWSDSENMNNYYNLARSLSGSNKKREAIEALNKAAGHGFTSRKTIELEPAFNNIRNDEKFKSLLIKLK